MYFGVVDFKVREGGEGEGFRVGREGAFHGGSSSELVARVAGGLHVFSGVRRSVARIGRGRV